MKLQKTFMGLFCFLSVGLYSCGQNNKSNEIKESGKEILAQIELITPIDLNAKLDTTLRLIDVRTPEEFASGAIKGAVNIDFSQAEFLEKMAGYNKDEPVYLYCRSGRRSANAALQLKKLGFVKIYDLKGGILAWQNENLTID